MKFHTHRVLEESIPYWSVIRLSHPVFCSILNYSLDSCTGVNIHLLGYSIEVEIQRWRPSSSFFPLNNERPTLRKDKCCVKPRAKWSRSTFGLGTSPSPSPWPMRASHCTLAKELLHAHRLLCPASQTGDRSCLTGDGGQPCILPNTKHMFSTPHSPLPGWDLRYWSLLSWLLGVSSCEGNPLPN